MPCTWTHWLCHQHVKTAKHELATSSAPARRPAWRSSPHHMGGVMGALLPVLSTCQMGFAL
eukprot:356731-Chlamydomonas_euryale.AAC.7